MGLINEVNNISATLNASEQNRRKREKQKRIDKIFYSNATKLLVDNLIAEIEDTGNYNIIYLDTIKDKIIDKTIYKDMAKRYKMESNDIEDLNFYLDDNYIKIANKTITTEKKKQKAIEFENNNTENQNLTFDEKALIIDKIVDTFLLLFPIFFIIYIIVRIVLYIK